jgi:histidine triad (HIT) family protein
MTECLFCRIAAGEIPADIVRRDDEFVAFRDISPTAPTHILVVPVQHYTDAGELAQADEALAGRLLRTAAQVAAADGIGADHRVVLNTGPGGGQSVFHVHAHVIGGRQMGWPPG